MKELNRKLQAKQNDLVELKHLNLDLVSKMALAHEESYLDSVIAKANSSITDRLLASVAKNKAVQSSVAKFKAENPDCDQWLSVAFELWEEKKKTGAGSAKKKDEKPVKKSKVSAVAKRPAQDLPGTPIHKTPKKLQTPKKQNGVVATPSQVQKTPKTPKGTKTPTRSYTPKFEVTEMSPVENDSLNKVAHSNKTAVIKRFNLSSNLDRMIENELNNNNEANEQESDDDDNEAETNQSKARKVKDKFFLTGDDDDEDDEDEMNDDAEDEEDEESFQKFSKNQRNKSQFINLKGKSQKPNRFQNGANSKGQQNRKSNQSPFGGPKDKSSGEDEGKLHPSWKARMEAKQKQKILLDNPMAKRITFD